MAVELKKIMKDTFISQINEQFGNELGANIIEKIKAKFGERETMLVDELIKCLPFEGKIKSDIVIRGFRQVNQCIGKDKEGNEKTIEIPIK